MKKKIIRSCELKKGCATVWVHLIKKTDRDGSETYIVDDRYQYITRKGEMISEEATTTVFYDRDVAIESYNAVIKVWL